MQQLSFNADDTHRRCTLARALSVQILPLCEGFSAKSLLPPGMPMV
jgi:hypothetical protein